MKTLYVVGDIEAYGSEATPETVMEFVEFVKQWLHEHGMEKVEIEVYRGFPPPYADDEIEESNLLLEKIWEDWIRS